MDKKQVEAGNQQYITDKQAKGQYPSSSQLFGVEPAEGTALTLLEMFTHCAEHGLSMKMRAAQDSGYPAIAVTLYRGEQALTRLFQHHEFTIQGELADSRLGKFINEVYAAMY